MKSWNFLISLGHPFKMNIPIKELNFKFSRSSGAGGQNVNKVNSKVTLVWKFHDSHSISTRIKRRLVELFPRRINDKGEIYLTSQRFRDQPRNIADCISKLEEMLEKAAHRPKVRKPTKPTKAAKEKRLKNKKQHGDKKRLRKSKPEY